jgi:hypothetical protein
VKHVLVLAAPFVILLGIGRVLAARLVAAVAVLLRPRQKDASDDVIVLRK